jgi:predicted AAA+ superfamily ATPase
VSIVPLKTTTEALEKRSPHFELVEPARGPNDLDCEIGYFRDRNDEVDYVVTARRQRIGIEVKSGRAGKLTGLRRFVTRFERARSVLVGTGGIPLEEALRDDPRSWLGLR